MMPEPSTLAHLAVVTTGAPSGGTELQRVQRVVVEDPAHVDPLVRSGVATGPTVVFSPTESAAHSGSGDGLSVVTYRGALVEPGDQLWLDDTFVMEVQSYAVSQFLAVCGPTLVRITGTEDLMALAQDAERARGTGRFSPIHTSPAVYLADTTALGWTGGSGGPDKRLHVRADGSISVSPSGVPLGRLGVSNAAELRAAWVGAGAATAAACPVALGAVLDDAERRSVLDAQPWLPRYLAVVAAVRAVRARGIVVDGVSGFGSRLGARLPLEDGRSPVIRPVIVWSEQSAFVVAPATARCVPLDLDRAAAFEAFLDGPAASRERDDTLGARVAAALGQRGFAVDGGRAA